MKSPKPLTFRLAAGVPSGVRLPQFDALKGLAMALVLEYHWHGATGAVNGDALKGEVGVDIFLIASGILLGINSQDLSAGEFLKRRFFRIFPSYWAALALFLYFNLRCFADHRPASDIWLHVVGLHGFARPGDFSAINDSFWFISVIVLLYAAFLGLRRRLGDLGLLIAVGGALTLGLSVYYQATGNGGGAGHLAVRIPSVFLGLILGRVASGRPVEFSLGPTSAIGLALLAYLAVERWYVFEYPLLGLAWVVGFLSADRWLRRRHGGRVLLSAFSFLGVYSYEIYLLHQPLIRDYNKWTLAACWQILEPSHLQILASMAAALGVVMVASVLLHRASDALFRTLRTSRRPAPALGEA